MDHTSEKPGFENQTKYLASETPSNVYRPPGPSTFRTTFACLSLHGYDRIRMIQFPPEDVAAIRSVIQRFWHKGIQKEGQYSTSYEFKVYGNPWAGQAGDSIPARIVIREIFAHLYSQGWILHASTDISKSRTDKDSLIFRKQQTPPPISDWAAVSFNLSDRLRFIGAPEDLLAEIRALLKSIELLQSEDWKDATLSAWEFKLRGHPWRTLGEETMRTRFMLLKLLETLENRGWSLYASIDQNTATDNRSETDSWYLVKDRSWVEGMAVFHR